MKIVNVILPAVFALVLASCGNDEQSKQVSKEIPREKFIEQIKKYEDQMHTSVTLDANLGTIAAKAYSDFATMFPDDSLSPDYLFKAGEISTATQQYSQALVYYQRICDKYPAFKLAPESLYLQGYLLDNFLNDDAKAKVIYEQVIAKYPALPYANDAKAAINNLGKTDEELIREFEKKNKGV